MLLTRLLLETVMDLLYMAIWLAQLSYWSQAAALHLLFRAVCCPWVFVSHLIAPHVSLCCDGWGWV